MLGELVTWEPPSWLAQLQAAALALPPLPPPPLLPWCQPLPTARPHSRSLSRSVKWEPPWWLAEHSGALQLRARRCNRCGCRRCRHSLGGTAAIVHDSLTPARWAGR